MERYTLNVEESRELYEQYPQHFEVNDCYRNVFRVMQYAGSEFRAGQWKVAYGYVWVKENLLTRHCFIVTPDDEVIDPTVFASDSMVKSLADTRSRIYYTMVVFDNVADYIKAVIREGGYPALTETLRHNEKRAWRWARDNGFVLCG